MAEIVAAYVVPHTPSFIAEVSSTRTCSRTSLYFEEIKDHFDEAAPELIITINNDHLNTFFLDNWPTFAIGIADQTSGPSDRTPGMPRYDVAIERGLARHLLNRLVETGFDFAWSEEFEIDHGLLVPLHFLTPGMTTPIVPIFINCIVSPLPPARRCHALGRALRDGIRSWDGPARVAVLASGSLSLEIGGPRAALGQTFGVPDPEWAAWILERLRVCDHDGLIAAATERRMLAAGNVAGELLNWITVLGLVGPSAPGILIDQPELGNAFAAWSLEGGRR